ncbi:MAG: hypothetical protein WAL87_06690 [Chthoniobacterales bacterium]
MKIMKVDPTGGSYHATAAKVAKSGINPEFALGISENTAGQVKRVKKVECYNVDPGEP